MVGGAGLNTGNTMNSKRLLEKNIKYPSGKTAISVFRWPREVQMARIPPPKNRAVEKARYCRSKNPHITLFLRNGPIKQDFPCAWASFPLRPENRVIHSPIRAFSGFFDCRSPPPLHSPHHFPGGEYRLYRELAPSTPYGSGDSGTRHG